MSIYRQILGKVWGDEGRTLAPKQRIHRRLGIEELELRVAPAGTQPTGVDLLAAYDSGISNSDSITNLNNSAPGSVLVFRVSGTVVGETIRVYDGVTLIGTAVAAGATTDVTTDGSTTLADGDRSITATGDDGTGESAASPALTITVDTVVPGAPSAPALQAGSDSGIYNNDGITNINTPTFDISGVTVGEYWRIYRDGTLVSQTPITGDDAGIYKGPFVGPTDTETLGTQADGVGYVYTARAVDAAGNESVDSTGTTVTIDTIAPTAPNAPSLQAGSDTGISNSDGITRDNTPTFDISGVTVGEYWRIYRDGTLVSQTPITGDDAGIYKGPFVGPTDTETLGTQADGVGYVYTARAVDAAGNESGDSAGTTVTIDTVAPAAPTNAPAIQGPTITPNTTPTFDITSVAPDYWRIYRGAVVASGPPTTGDDGGIYKDGATTSETLAVQPYGTFIFTYRSVDVAGNESAASPGQTVTFYNGGSAIVLDAAHPIYHFIDADGDTIALGFSGPGSATIMDAGGGAPDHTDIASIALAGTTIKSCLNITDTSDRGPNTIVGGDITGPSLLRLRLQGPYVSAFTGYIGTVEDTTLTLTGNCTSLVVLAGIDTVTVQITQSLGQMTISKNSTALDVTVGGNISMFSTEGNLDASTLTVTGGLVAGIFRGTCNNFTMDVGGNVDRALFYGPGGLTGCTVTIDGNTRIFHSRGNISNTDVTIGGNVTLFRCVSSVMAASTVHVVGTTTTLMIGRGLLGTSSLQLDGNVSTLQVQNLVSADSIDATSSITMGAALLKRFLVIGSLKGTVDITGSAATSLIRIAGNLDGDIVPAQFGNVTITGKFTGTLGGAGTANGVNNLLYVCIAGGGGTLTPSNAIFARRVHA